MPKFVQKKYLDAQQLLEDSFALGAQILQSGFKPTFIIAIWRGGVPMGVAVQEFLAYHGVLTDHISVRTASYSGIDQQSREINVFGLGYLVKNICHRDRLLIVDDVFDTGRSIEAIIVKINKMARLNAPHEIKVAVPYYKPERIQVTSPPDFYIHKTNEWLKYPHSLEGLSPDEIKQHRPEIYEIIKAHL